MQKSLPLSVDPTVKNKIDQIGASNTEVCAGEVLEKAGLVPIRT